MNEFIYHLILVYLTSIIDLIGVIVITLGVVYTIFRFCLGYFGKKKALSIDALRLQLGRAIVFAVEFLLAADIIRTMVAPDYYSLGLLGGLVVIRTVLTYFLDLELQSLVHKK